MHTKSLWGHYDVALLVDVIIPSGLYIKGNLTNERFFQYKWFFDISKLTVGHGYMGCHVKLPLMGLSHFCSSSKSKQ